MERLVLVNKDIGAWFARKHTSEVIKESKKNENRFGFVSGSPRVTHSVSCVNSPTGVTQSLNVSRSTGWIKNHQHQTLD